MSQGDQMQRRTDEVHRGQDGERGRERRQRHAEPLSAEVHRPRRQAAHRRQPAGRQRGARPRRRAQPERQADACMRVTPRLLTATRLVAASLSLIPKSTLGRLPIEPAVRAAWSDVAASKAGGVRSDPRFLIVTIRQALAST
jgi:hypothetical protein